MISRADTVNLSNMPVESEEIIGHDFNFPEDLTDILAPTKNDNDKWKITKFQTTPLMSSYLVAFANGPFEFLETSVVMPLSGKTVPLRIYSENESHPLFLVVLMGRSDPGCNSSGPVCP
jgi:aminopeptidase 2